MPPMGAVAIAIGITVAAALTYAVVYAVRRARHADRQVRHLQDQLAQLRAHVASTQEIEDAVRDVIQKTSPTNGNGEHADPDPKPAQKGRRLRALGPPIAMFVAAAEAGRRLWREHRPELVAAGTSAATVAAIATLVAWPDDGSNRTPDATIPDVPWAGQILTPAPTTTTVTASPIAPTTEPDGSPSPFRTTVPPSTVPAPTPTDTGPTPDDDGDQEDDDSDRNDEESDDHRPGPPTNRPPSPPSHPDEPGPPTNRPPDPPQPGPPAPNPPRHCLIETDVLSDLLDLEVLCRESE